MRDLTRRLIGLLRREKKIAITPEMERIAIDAMAATDMTSEQAFEAIIKHITRKRGALV